MTLRRRRVVKAKRRAHMKTSTIRPSGPCSLNFTPQQMIYIRGLQKQAYDDEMTIDALKKENKSLKTGKEHYKKQTFEYYNRAVKCHNHHKKLKEEAKHYKDAAVKCHSHHEKLIQEAKHYKDAAVKCHSHHKKLIEENKQLKQENEQLKQKLEKKENKYKWWRNAIIAAAVVVQASSVAIEVYRMCSFWGGEADFF